VLSVVAQVGQAVRAGDTVLMLEAMKMELPVRAPRDGVVTAIHCRAGELVQPGAVLVDMT
jgi:3-methylcrotonyl-CoA carboxylase alpha subunit